RAPARDCFTGHRAQRAEQVALDRRPPFPRQRADSLRTGEPLLEMLPNATFELLRAKSAAGHLLEKLPSQERFKNQPLFQGDARRRARPKKLALHLEAREGVNQRLAGLNGLLYPVHQLVKAEVER